MLTVVGVSVVFVALLVLYWSIALLSKAINYQRKDQLIKKGSGADAVATTLQMSGETAAAIATALHLYFQDIHDQENTVLTIKRLSKSYRPWSSKIYMVMGLNRRMRM